GAFVHTVFPMPPRRGQDNRRALALAQSADHADRDPIEFRFITLIEAVREAIASDDTAAAVQNAVDV
ncbi:MAG TPA: hypothetical protein VJQ59_04705, partial [Candidatus Sulfotelmatobacter sp.]|nr:hypothetical protein [Candidatus Sulfotelmatobacter sp.]